MAKRFALSAVLTIREQREQAEERALAQMNARCAEIQSVLRDIAKHIDQEGASRFVQIGEVQLAAQFLASDRQLASLRSAQAEMQKQLVTVEKQRKQQQEKYLAAHSGREMLTEMKNRAREIWEKDESLREQKWLQDIFLSRRKPANNPEGTKRS